jgi:hypothetical protein
MFVGSNPVSTRSTFTVAGRISATLLLLGALLWPSGAGARPLHFGQDEQQVQPALRLAGVQLADRVRYAVTLLRPSGAGLANLKVAVNLPNGAEVVDTLQTGGRTVFLGNADGVLNWAAPGYAADEPGDALTFSLRQAAGEPIGVKATWTDDDGSAAEKDSLWRRPSRQPGRRHA